VPTHAEDVHGLRRSHREAWHHRTVTAAPAPDVWDRIWAVAPAPPLGLVVAAALVAFAATAVPDVWKICRHVLTIAHEGAHGLAALAVGRRLSGIRLHSNSSGLTVSQGRSTGPGMMLTAVAGYLGPAVSGLVAAVLLAHGHAVGVLWALLALLVLMLVQIRNLFGLAAVLVAGSLLVAVTRWASADTQLLSAYVVTWFLLLGAPRDVVVLQAFRRGGRDRTSDAALMARLTHLPGIVWVGFFWLGTLACLVLGGRLLLGAAA
jgi:hypothetical protein